MRKARKLSWFAIGVVLLGGLAGCPKKQPTPQEQQQEIQETDALYQKAGQTQGQGEQGGQGQ